MIPAPLCVSSVFDLKSSENLNGHSQKTSALYNNFGIDTKQAVNFLLKNCKMNSKKFFLRPMEWQEFCVYLTKVWFPKVKWNYDKSSLRVGSWNFLMFVIILATPLNSAWIEYANSKLEQLC